MRAGGTTAGAASRKHTDGRCPGCRKPWPRTAAHCLGCGRLRASVSCSRHRDRVAERACLVCRRPLCRECRRGGRHAPVCRAHEHVRLIQGWAEVARTADEMSGTLVAGRLRSFGLDAALLCQANRCHVVTFGGLAVVRILVPADQYRDATDALREADAGPPAAG